jgi:sugar O-acyltransferase (sialic acid O-acetyltransferase NeuD family)
MQKDLIIFGTGPFAQVAKCYFQEDSIYDIKAFSVNKEFIQSEKFEGLPVIAYEELMVNYPPSKYTLFIATGFGKLNQLKEMIYTDAKKKGYEFATYVNSKIKIWSNNSIGENVFIFEDNTIQPYAKIGNSVVCWSGNHIGHHTVIEDYCFITSHIVISGFTRIGKRCYIGVNAALKDNIVIGEGNIIGAGTLIMNNTNDYEVFIGNTSRKVKLDSRYVSI